MKFLFIKIKLVWGMTVILTSFELLTTQIVETLVRNPHSETCC